MDSLKQLSQRDECYLTVKTLSTMEERLQKCTRKNGLDMEGRFKLPTSALIF